MSRAPVPVPVVVGTGLTGCALSRSLSRAGIPHLLVGPAPAGEGPRIGESLNLEGSLDLVDYFPELSSYYLAKTAVTAHVGDVEVRCDLNMQRGRASAAFYAALGYPRPPDAFLHVERRGFDNDVFAAVVADPHCTHVDDRVERVDYDAARDRVVRLHLAGGAAIEPAAVFDATNHVRAIARHLGLRVTTLGAPQRAAYGHFEYRGEPREDDALWHSTHIVRMDRETDGVDALTWYIPLKGLASIGVGADFDPDDPAPAPDHALVVRAFHALERRGILPEGAFAIPERVRSIPRYDHFLHDRAYGSNWLLAGGTFCIMWFAASAGISSGFAAANCAPHFLRDPERYGRLYQEILIALQRPHAVFEWLRRSDPRTTGAGELERRADALVEQSVLRLALSVRLRPGVVRGAVAGLLAAAIQKKRFDPSGICVRVRDRARADGEALKRARIASLERILAVFAGAAPVEAIAAEVHDDVVVHIDRLRFRGLSGWRKWARHSRATWPFDQLRFEVVDAEHEVAGDRLTVAIAAVGRRRGAAAEERSPAERFVYRFDGDKVREIWTSRRNYTFLYGERFGRLPGFMGHVARLVWWNLRHPEADHGRAAAE